MTKILKFGRQTFRHTSSIVRFGGSIEPTHSNCLILCTIAIIQAEVVRFIHIYKSINRTGPTNILIY